ncbi:MAG: hypothetical protein LBH16_02830 [Treponema sp.]|jgi:hypothetical protein|nr:hypothetical protein [Treponema sp.]
MGIEQDLAKAQELRDLGLNIQELETKVQNIRAEFQKKIKAKKQDFNAEIKQLFMTVFNRPELQLSKTETEVKACTDELSYAVQFNEEEHCLYKKLGRDEKRFTFHYKHNFHFYGGGCSGSNEIELKKAQISDLERQLNQYTNALQSIDKDGLYIEYASVEINPLRNSLHNNGRNKGDAKNYTKIEMGNLLQLIQ